ncbi:MAG TPA: glucuronate isomerase, partial [Ignavibacteriaceae bacterium]|nr:glucuronate isomerase [Ignavibacteriaceae bacterium]
MSELKLSPDRFFDPNQSVRKIAREIYNSVKSLPIISPHGHVDPSLFSENKPFPNPTQLFLIPDHYIYRMLYSQGLATLEELGIPDINGNVYESNPKKIWDIFASNYYLFNGTPSGVWLDYEFSQVFGIKEKLNAKNGMKIYEQLQKKING